MIQDFEQKFYGECNILLFMSAQSFSSIGSALLKIEAHLDLSLVKYCICVNCF